MKYSEFNKELVDMELQYAESDIYIYCDGIMLGKVSRLYRYKMSTFYEGLNQFPDVYVSKMLMAMVKLSKTPLAEREEEKRYYLKKILIPLLRENDDKWYSKPLLPNYGPCARRDREQNFQYQTIFTESEIKKMDITGFYKEEVK